MTEYLRMGGIYWCLTTMALLNKLQMMDKEEIVKFVMSCQHPCGGFGASIEHDPHLLHTLSAVQVGIQFFLTWIFRRPSEGLNCDFQTCN